MTVRTQITGYTNAVLSARILLDREPSLNLTTGDLHVGNGATPGGSVKLLSEASLQAAYLTQTSASATYQPKNTQLTDIAAASSRGDNKLLIASAAGAFSFIEDYNLIAQFLDDNLIINSEFVYNERNYLGGAVAGANTYVYDRWRIKTAGQSAPKSGYVVTCPAGGLEQIVEGFNTPNYAGANYVANWSGSATLEVNGVVRAKNASFTLNAGNNNFVWKNGTLSFPVVKQGTRQAIYFPRNHTLEGLLCARYYQSRRAYLNMYGIAGAAGSVQVTSRVPMRVFPTVTAVANTLINAGSMSVVAIDNSLFLLSATPAASSNYLADATVFADAEIP